MEHRKRNRMQHKTMLSTMLRITTATSETCEIISDEADSKKLVKELASQAMQSLKNYEHAAIIKQTIL